MCILLLRLLLFRLGSALLSQVFCVLGVALLLLGQVFCNRVVRLSSFLGFSLGFSLSLVGRILLLLCFVLLSKILPLFLILEMGVHLCVCVIVFLAFLWFVSLVCSFLIGVLCILEC